MGTKIALDTNIVVQILNGNTEWKRLFQKYEEVVLPIVVCGELLFGAANSGRKVENRQKIIRFLDACTILPANMLVAEQYSIVRKKLKDIGRPIPENDIWIAATCIVYSLPLITLDKHFSYVADLDNMSSI